MKIAELILKYIEVLIWPIITIFIAIRFKKELIKLFGRAKKVELPGGFSIEAFEDKLNEAKKLDKELKSERNQESSEIIKQFKNTKSEANIKMVEKGLRPSPSGLDLNYYRQIAKSDVSLAAAGLRMEFELLIRNLAFGFKIDSSPQEPIVSLIKKLGARFSITDKQIEFIKIIFQLTNYAVHGGEITREQFEDVLNLGETLVDDYRAWLNWNYK